MSDSTRREGVIIRVDVDGVIVQWNDGTSSIVDFYDSKKKAYAAGDKVVWNAANPWSWDGPSMVVTGGKTEKEKQDEHC